MRLLTWIVALCLPIVACLSVETSLHQCTDVENGADINAQDDWGETPLHQCCKEAMARLSLNGAEVESQDFRNWNPFKCHRAVERAKLLLEKGADVMVVDVWGFSALHYAAGSGEYKLVKLLLDHGSNPNLASRNGYTPLHLASLACKSGKTVELLLSRGANVMACAKDGCTPLHIASGRVGRCNPGSSVSKLIAKMLKQGFNLDASDNKGRTALHHAIEVCCASCIKLLVDNGANLNIANREGEAPLYLAFRSCGSIRDDILEMLLDRGADVTANFYDGTTPLHLAARGGELKTANLLITHMKREGIDIDLLDSNGHTSLFATMHQLEYLCHTTEMARLLLANGANIDQIYWINRTVIGEFYREALDYLEENLDWEGIDLDLRPYIEDLANKLFSAKLTFSMDYFVPRVVREYQVEIDELKREKIYRDLSYYDFLHNDDPFIARKISDTNHDLANLPVYFPAYGNLLYGKIKIDTFRVNLISSARIQLLFHLRNSPELRNLNLPKEIIDEIVFSLTNAELARFTEWRNVNRILKTYKRMIGK